MMADILDRIIHNVHNGHENSKRTLTVRMPSSLYDAIMAEAKSRKISANKLAIAKLSVKCDVLENAAKSFTKEPSSNGDS